MAEQQPIGYQIKPDAKIELDANEIQSILTTSEYILEIYRPLFILADILKMRLNKTGQTTPIYPEGSKEEAESRLKTAAKKFIDVRGEDLTVEKIAEREEDAKIAVAVVDEPKEEKGKIVKLNPKKVKEELPST